MPAPVVVAALVSGNAIVKVIDTVRRPDVAKEQREAPACYVGAARSVRVARRWSPVNCGYVAMLPLKRNSSRPAHSDPIGELAGEYRLLRKIGAGGFGTVYEAEHPVLKRKAAVKVLHANAGVESVAVKRFLEEARSASQIRHRHIVDIFSFGTLPNGQYFYVMDLLDGMALDRYIRQQGRLAPELALPLLRRVAQAIDALHAASIIHRDVKPANIFLAWESSGEVVPKLLDFGLVKLVGNVSLQTASGVPIGTPYYMSPEQCRGETVDGRADVYSFGVICHEVLTGRVPFERDSAAAVLLAHVMDPPPRISEVCPELSVDLDEPVLRMLSKDPGARPETASAAVLELTLAAQGGGVTLSDSLPWLPRPTPEPRAELDQYAPTEMGDGPHLSSGTRKKSSGAGSPRRLVPIALVVFGAIAALVYVLSRPGGPSTSAPPAIASGSAPQPPSASERAHSPPADAPSHPPTTAPVLTPAAVPVPAAVLGASAQPATGSEPGTPPTSEAAPPPTSAADRVPLLVRAAPPGAIVMLGDEKLGEVPGPLLLPRGDRPLRLKVVAPGYVARTLRVTPSGPLDLQAPLEKLKPAKPHGPGLHDLEDPF